MKSKATKSSRPSGRIPAPLRGKPVGLGGMSTKGKGKPGGGGG